MFKSRTIKTNIKFIDGLDNIKGRFYGFVTKVNGSWKGCREETSLKKIVLIDPSLVADIVPNILYRCTLIPMNNDNGFIVVGASIVKFEASIITTCNDNAGIFTVLVKFGNKEIRYDPSSKVFKKSDIANIAEVLRKRVDLKDAIQVAEDFISNACIVKRMYNQYLLNVSGKNVL